MKVFSASWAIQEIQSQTAGHRFKFINCHDLKKKKNKPQCSLKGRICGSQANSDEAVGWTLSFWEASSQYIPRIF